MRPVIIQFLLCIALLTALDVAWFTLVMGKFFIAPLSHLLNIHDGHVTLRWFPAILVYIFLALGIVLFVIPAGGPLAQYPVFLRGALFGMIVYGVYEGSSGALMKDWPTSLIVVDILWGSLVSSITSAVAAFLVP